jgi:hypothetical protein
VLCRVTALIIGEDGHVRDRADLVCQDETEARRLAEQLVAATTSSYGSLIAKSRPSGTALRLTLIIDLRLGLEPEF